MTARTQTAVMILVLILFADFGLAATRIFRYTGWGDFRAYYAAAVTLEDGGNIYNDEHLNASWRKAGDLTLTDYSHGYVYPPLFAAAITPLTRLSVRSAARVWFLLNVCLWGLAIWLLARYLRIGLITLEGLVLIGVALRFEPVLHTFIAGQVNVLVFVCVMGCLCLRDQSKPLAGAALASAVMIKISPVVIAGYFLFRKDYRLLFWTFLSGLLLLGISMTAAGWSMHVAFLRDALPALSLGSASPFNQSFLGAALRLVDALGWNESVDTVRTLAKAVGLIFIADAGRRIWLNRNAENEHIDLSFLILTVSIASPITWSHHLVWAILPVMVLVRSAIAAPLSSRLTAAAVLVFAVLVVLDDFYVHPVFLAGPFFWVSSIKLISLIGLYWFIAKARPARERVHA